MKLCNFRTGSCDVFSDDVIPSSNDIARNYIPQTYGADAQYRVFLAKGFSPVTALKMTMNNETHTVTEV